MQRFPRTKVAYRFKTLDESNYDNFCVRYLRHTLVSQAYFIEQNISPSRAASTVELVPNNEPFEDSVLDEVCSSINGP